MPKRTDINRILVIGSGPIIIGQAAEFDYAGTQACQSLKEEGYEVILVNSNPATIMTDTEVADKVYMEPLTKEFLSKILLHFSHINGYQVIVSFAARLMKHMKMQVMILGNIFFFMI